MDHILEHRDYFASWIVGAQGSSKGGGSDEVEAYVTARLDATPNAAIWGDHVEIIALAELLDRPVDIYSSETQTVEPTSIVEAVDPHSEPIRLSYHGGEHYNSVTTDPDSTWKPLGLLGSSKLKESRLRRERSSAAKTKSKSKRK